MEYSKENCTFCIMEPLFLAHFLNDIHSIMLPMQIGAYTDELETSSSSSLQNEVKFMCFNIYPLFKVIRTTTV